MLRAFARAMSPQSMLGRRCGTAAGMIDHTGLAVSDPERSKHFYDHALAALGYTMLMAVPREFTGGRVTLGYGVRPKPDFWMTEGPPNEPRIHVAFRADSRQQVDEFYKAALAAGTTAPPDLVRIITRATMARSCSTPTGTTSRPCATPPSGDAWADGDEGKVAAPPRLLTRRLRPDLRGRVHAHPPRGDSVACR